MKFLYKQPVNNLDPGAVFFRCLGVHQCYFKHLFSERDAAGMTYKRHHHTHYEVHMVESGCVGYEVDGKEYILNIGHFLVLPPQTAIRRPFVNLAPLPYPLLFGQKRTSAFCLR